VDRTREGTLGGTTEEGRGKREEGRGKREEGRGREGMKGMKGKTGCRRRRRYLKERGLLHKSTNFHCQCRPKTWKKERSEV
jgi:hypothetical protein